MDCGAMVSQGWKVMLQNKSLWGIAAIILISKAAIELVLPDGKSVVGSLINTGVTSLFGALLSGVLITMVVGILEQRPHGIVRSFRKGIHWFLPLFVLIFSLSLPNWILSLVNFGSDSSVLKNGAEIFNELGIFLVIQFPVSLLCSAILIGAERAIILESHSVGAALKRGWQLLRKHLGDYLEISIRIFIIVVVGLVAFGCGVETLRLILHSPLTPNTSEVKLSSLIINILLSGFGAVVWTLAFREWQAQERSELSVAIGQN